jgi:[ribosomal protein S5]-alanine N-acetyltransferase
MKPPDLFSTKRLNGEPLSKSHAAFIQELLNTEGWITFIGDKNIHTEADAFNYIQRISDNEAIYYWVMRLKENQQPVGVVTFIQRDYLPNPDIGFAFLPAFQRTGYAYEAAHTLLKELKDFSKEGIILASTTPANANSIRLLTKLGLQFERELEQEGETLLIYSTQ